PGTDHHCLGCRNGGLSPESASSPAQNVFCTVLMYNWWAPWEGLPALRRLLCGFVGSGMLVLAWWMVQTCRMLPPRWMFYPATVIPCLRMISASPICRG